MAFRGDSVDPPLHTARRGSPSHEEEPRTQRVRFVPGEQLVYPSRPRDQEYYDFYGERTEPRTATEEQDWADRYRDSLNSDGYYNDRRFERDAELGGPRRRYYDYDDDTNYSRAPGFAHRHSYPEEELSYYSDDSYEPRYYRRQRSPTPPPTSFYPRERRYSREFRDSSPGQYRYAHTYPRPADYPDPIQTRINTLEQRLEDCFQALEEQHSAQERYRDAILDSRIRDARALHEQESITDRRESERRDVAENLKELEKEFQVELKGKRERLQRLEQDVEREADSARSQQTKGGELEDAGHPSEELSQRLKDMEHEKSVLSNELQNTLDEFEHKSQIIREQLRMTDMTIEDSRVKEEQIRVATRQQEEQDASQAERHKAAIAELQREKNETASELALCRSHQEMERARARRAAELDDLNPRSYYQSPMGNLDSYEENTLQYEEPGWFEEGPHRLQLTISDVEKEGLSVNLALNKDILAGHVVSDDENATRPQEALAWRQPKATLSDGKSSTELLVVNASEYEKGAGKTTLFCPGGPQKQDESPSAQIRWLHVQQPVMRFKTLEQLVLNCPGVTDDIRAVAIETMGKAKEKFSGTSECGSHIEPGSILRYIGKYNQTSSSTHDDQSETEPVLFLAAPFLTLQPTVGRGGIGEYRPRTLLQSLYGYDVGVERERSQVVQRLEAVGTKKDTLHVSQLWCLLIGSSILITISEKSADEIRGKTVNYQSHASGKGGPLTLCLTDEMRREYNVVIEADCNYVDFLKYAVALIAGNDADPSRYELLDKHQEVLMPNKWVQILNSSESQRHTLTVRPKYNEYDQYGDERLEGSTVGYSRSRSRQRTQSRSRHTPYKALSSGPLSRDYRSDHPSLSRRRSRQLDVQVMPHEHYNSSLPRSSSREYLTRPYRSNPDFSLRSEKHEIIPYRESPRHRERSPVRAHVRFDETRRSYPPVVADRHDSNVPGSKNAQGTLNPIARAGLGSSSDPHLNSPEHSPDRSSRDSGDDVSPKKNSEDNAASSAQTYQSFDESSPEFGPESEVTEYFHLRQLSDIEELSSPSGSPTRSVSRLDNSESPIGDEGEPFDSLATPKEPEDQNLSTEPNRPANTTPSEKDPRNMQVVLYQDIGEPIETIKHAPTRLGSPEEAQSTLHINEPWKSYLHDTPTGKETSTRRSTPKHLFRYVEAPTNRFMNTSNTYAPPPASPPPPPPEPRPYDQKSSATHREPGYDLVKRMREPPPRSRGDSREDLSSRRRGARRFVIPPGDLPGAKSPLSNSRSRSQEHREVRELHTPPYNPYAPTHVAPIRPRSSYHPTSPNSYHYPESDLQEARSIREPTSGGQIINEAPVSKRHSPQIYGLNDDESAEFSNVTRRYKSNIYIGGDTEESKENENSRCLTHLVSRGPKIVHKRGPFDHKRGQKGVLRVVIRRRLSLGHADLTREEVKDISEDGPFDDQGTRLFYRQNAATIRDDETQEEVQYVDECILDILEDSSDKGPSKLHFKWPSTPGGDTESSDGDSDSDSDTSTGTGRRTLPSPDQVPFLKWRLTHKEDTRLPEEVEKNLVMILGRLNKSISNNIVGRLYSRTYKCTMKDLLQRHVFLKKTPDDETDDKSHTRPTPQSHTTSHAGDFKTSETGDKGTKKAGSNELNPDANATIAAGPQATGEDFEGEIGDSQRQGTSNSNSPSPDSISSKETSNPDSRENSGNPEPEPKSPGSINGEVPQTSPRTPKPEAVKSESSTGQPPGTSSSSDWRQGQNMQATSHDKEVMKALFSVSQDIYGAYVPDTGSPLIHPVSVRFWGSIDGIFRQLAWESADHALAEDRMYTIRDFDGSLTIVGESNSSSSSTKKKSWAKCSSCKSQKTFASATEALEHLHKQHFECTAKTERPYDDPCFVWLRRTSSSNYSRPQMPGTGNLGQVEDFISRLLPVYSYTRELHDLVASARDNTSNARPPLPASLVEAFEQVISMYIIQSQWLSLNNRRRSLPSDTELIEYKIDELLGQEEFAKQRVYDLLQEAKKDIILLKGTSRHIDSLGVEAVGAEFVVLNLLVNLQNRPILCNSTFTTADKADFIDLYQKYTSHLRFRANRRPQKRVFLDIHALEEELDALLGVVEAQSSLVRNYLRLLYPGSTRTTSTTRMGLYKIEKEYAGKQQRLLQSKEDSIRILKEKSEGLKEQVKKTIEILEEDHGKAIRVFTFVTLLFLPLSFVSSFMGMNTTDVRDTVWDQRIFWATGLPVTFAVILLALLYAYRGEAFEDWLVTKVLPSIKGTKRNSGNYNLEVLEAVQVEGTVAGAAMSQTEKKRIAHVDSDRFGGRYPPQSRDGPRHLGRGDMQTRVKSVRNKWLLRRRGTDQAGEARKQTTDTW